MREPGTVFSLIDFRITLSPYPALTLSMRSSGFGRLSGGRKLKVNGLSTCAGAISSMRSSILMRLCACLALEAFARKRSI